MKRILKITVFCLVLIFVNFYCVAQSKARKKPVVIKKPPTIAFNTQSTNIVVPSQCPCTFPPISFEGENIKLTDRAKSILKASAETLKQNPESFMVVKATSLSSKSGLSKCNNKLMQVKYYLSEVQGISYDRIVIDCQIVEDGNNTKIMELTCENNK